MMTSGELRSRLEAGVPVAVWGRGASGVAAFDWIAACGGAPRAFDEKGDDSYPRVAARFPVVVSSPGFGPRHPWRARAQAAGAMVISELDLASLWFAGRILAITGTNGKTTICQLLGEALSRLGLSGPPCGNIGLPFCDWLHEYRERAWAVVEVSSFQAQQSVLWRPAGVIWTSFAGDHLEVHGDLHAYFSAKSHLLNRLSPGGTAWVSGEVREWSERLGIPLPANCLIPRPATVAAPGGGPFQHPPFLGNYQLAWSWFVQQGWPEAVLQSTAWESNFPPHRLQVLGEWDGVIYVDDSKGTNFSAVEAALWRFAGRRILWIGGGRNKGGDVGELASILASRVAQAWTLGEAGPALGEVLKSSGVPASFYPDLTNAVQAAARMARHGDVVLFSPGFSSLDQFADYRERGRSFQEAVFALNRDESADLVRS